MSTPVLFSSQLVATTTTYKLVFMYGETLVELPVGLMGCCVEADIAGVYMMQRCYTEVLELEDHCKGIVANPKVFLDPTKKIKK
uniref:Uncharacterized protein n=1 Tax=Populus trichocarpa TaxID=3694 RepID=A0A2K1XJ25_POPTR